MIRKQLAIRLLPLVVISLVGCGITGSEDCVLGFVNAPVLEITVMDAVTGEPIAEGATGVVVEGSFSEELEEVPPDGSGPVTALGFYSLRNGEYEVTINQNGYRTWVQTVVIAVENECAFERPVVEITAELTPDRG